MVQLCRYDLKVDTPLAWILPTLMIVESPLAPASPTTPQGNAQVTTGDTWTHNKPRCNQWQHLKMFHPTTAHLHHTHQWQHCSPPLCSLVQEFAHHHWNRNWPGAQILSTTMSPNIQRWLELLCCQLIWQHCLGVSTLCKREPTPSSHSQIQNSQWRGSCI